MTQERVFKGWTKPGPDFEFPQQGEAPIPLEDESLDYLTGMSRIFQLKEGHRYSTDDVLTAWYGTLCAPYPARILDLGSGLGSVAMIMAFKVPGSKITTIEAQSRSFQLSRKSVELNGYSDRFDQRQGDFRDPAVLESNQQFDLITGSPPYWPETDGVVSAHPQKRACRFEIRGGVEDYAEVAAKYLAPGAVFTCVFPIEPIHQLERVQEGAKRAGMFIYRWRPIVLKEGAAPMLAVFSMVRAGDLPERVRTQGAWKESDLVIRLKDGSISPEYTAIKLSIGFAPSER